MRNLVLLSTVAALVALTSFNAKATSVSNNQGKAKVSIVDPVALAHTGTALDFGTATSAETHHITVDPSTGTVSSDHTNQMVTVPGDGRDEFKITGPEGKSVTLAIPTTGLDLDTNGDVSVTAWTSSPAAGSVTIGSGGTIVKIGGTLTVNQGAATGDYEKTYTVTVSY